MRPATISTLTPNVLSFNFFLLFKMGEIFCHRRAARSALIRSACPCPALSHKHIDNRPVCEQPLLCARWEGLLLVFPRREDGWPKFPNRIDLEFTNGLYHEHLCKDLNTNISWSIYVFNTTLPISVCSGGAWWPNTLLRLFMLVFPLICHLSVYKHIQNQK